MLYCHGLLFFLALEKNLFLDFSQNSNENPKCVGTWCENDVWKICRLIHQTVHMHVGAHFPLVNSKTNRKRWHIDMLPYCTAVTFKQNLEKKVFCLNCLKQTHTDNLLSGWIGRVGGREWGRDGWMDGWRWAFWRTLYFSPLLKLSVPFWRYVLNCCVFVSLTFISIPSSLKCKTRHSSTTAALRGRAVVTGPNGNKKKKNTDNNNAG